MRAMLATRLPRVTSTTLAAKTVANSCVRFVNQITVANLASTPLARQQANLGGVTCAPSSSAPPMSAYVASAARSAFACSALFYIRPRARHFFHQISRITSSVRIRTLQDLATSIWFQQSSAFPPTMPCSGESSGSIADSRGVVAGRQQWPVIWQPLRSSRNWLGCVLLFALGSASCLARAASIANQSASAMSCPVSDKQLAGVIGKAKALTALRTNIAKNKFHVPGSASAGNKAVASGK